MKKYIFYLFIVAVLFNPTFAHASKGGGNSKNVKEVRQQLQKMRKKFNKQQKKVQENLKQSIKSLKGARISGTIITINNNALTVAADSKTYTVTVTKQTKIHRRFWGNAKLSELTVGHTVNVVGSWSNAEKTNITAKFVRDVSIQKRFGAFTGEVTQLSGATITIQSKARKTQTAQVNSSTKYENRKEEQITFNEVKIGHRVRLKGTWDKETNIIYNTTEVKNFSLPE